MELPLYFQLGMEKSLGRGTEDPPADYFEAAANLSAKGFRTVIVSYAYQWFLLREPTWKELKTYSSMHGYVPDTTDRMLQPASRSRGNVPRNHAWQIRRAAIAWLVERCVVYPTEFSKMEFPFTYPPGLIPRLLEHLLKYSNLSSAEIRKYAGKPRLVHPIDQFDMVVKAYDIPINLDEMSAREVYENIHRLEEIQGLKDAMARGGKLDVQPPQQPNGKQKIGVEARREMMAAATAAAEAKMGRGPQQSHGE